MNNTSIALIAACIVSSHLAAQPGGLRDWGRNPYDSPPAAPNLGVLQNPDGGVCFPAPSYQYCNYDLYNYYALDAYRFWAFSSFWSGIHESGPPHSSKTNQPPEPAPPPPPPPTPVVHEYHWPEEVNTSTTFSIVTTGGTLYLATMVWVEGDNLHFNSVDGGVRQIPLSSVSRSLTQTANAQKNLDLRLPWTQAPTSVSTAN